MTLDERFDDLAELVPAIVWVSNPEGECVYVNERWTELTGRPRERDLGRGWFEAMHPDDVEAAREASAAARRERRSYVHEMRLRRGDGAYRWMLDRASPRFSPAGAFLGYVGMVVDITERRIAEESLRTSEERFRALASSAPHMMWTLTSDGTIQHLNDRVEFVTGRAARASHVADWLSSVHPDDRLRTLRAWARTSRTRAPLVVEHRLLERSGDYCWHLTRAVPHRDGDGTVRHWYGTSTDVNDLKVAERALRDSTERLDAALAASLTGTYRWNIQRDLLEWDANLHLLFGLDPRSPVTSIEEVLPMIHPDDRPTVRAAIDRIVREGLDYIHEFRCVRPDGSTHWLSNRSRVTRDSEGRPMLLLGACTDITTRKNAELALQHAKDESERANLSKDRFLAVLSHELRTPLNPVTMILDMLASDERIAGDHRMLLETARRNVAVQARLIDDLLDVTRIASGKLRIQRSRLRAHEILRNVAGICAADIEAAGQRLTLALEAADDDVVADAERLTQVFWNLVRNASKFTPHGGSISITTSNEAADIRVDVTDTGVGVERAHLDRIFELFHQAPGDRRQGLGLGLAISRSIVELHGGAIRATSAGAGLGTTFSVLLPLSTSTGRGGGRSRVRVMVVEDDHPLREAIAMWLEARGYPVVQAASAEEALRLTQGMHVDVLVTDLYLPSASGFDLLRQMLRRQAVHGIAMSGSGDSADVERAIDAGFASYLVKPLDLDRLLAEIDLLAVGRESQP